MELEMEIDLLKPYDSLRDELTRAKTNLKGLNDNIRRIIGREPQEPDSRSERTAERKRTFNDTIRRNEVERPTIRRMIEMSPPPSLKRRPQESKSVFSRLSGPPVRNNNNNSHNNNDYEHEIECVKPRLHSRVIKELPTREEIVEAQGVDEQSRARNRRMFGCLLGTLQKFCQEESRLKTKEEKKAQIEKKLEEQELKERINMKKERQTLFIDRKRQQLEIRKLEMKMSLIREFEVWEKSKRDLFNFIKTKTKPALYYRPKIMNEKNEQKLRDSRTDLEKEIEEKKSQLNTDISEIVHRFKLREDEEELLADWERKEKSGENLPRHFRRKNSSGGGVLKSNIFHHHNDDLTNDSMFDDDENIFRNNGRDSKSVVITVRNNYSSVDLRENDYQSSDEHIVIKTENDDD